MTIDHNSVRSHHYIANNLLFLATYFYLLLCAVELDNKKV